MAEVVLEKVSHRYPEAMSDTFSNVDLVIEKGEAHALLGGSGAGKTTILNLLSGLARPSSGRIFFDGVDVTDVPPRERNVAQVFQFPVLYTSLSVAENLAFPLKNQGWRGDRLRARVRDIAERLELTDCLNRRPDSLSLFEKQLVAIGRALVRPEIALVLLDEPLTAVEPATKWQLRRVLKLAQEELNATMIYVTHDQTEALTFADRISVLHEGKLLQTGTPADLYQAPAHEHVAYFIGSPGMNLVPGEIIDDAYRLDGCAVAPAMGVPSGPCVVGFRPEWAEVTTKDVEGPMVTVTRTRVLGTRDHQPMGIVSVDLQGQTIHTRQALNVAVGATARLSVREDRVVGFRAGIRLHGGLANA